jgi:plastocyanin
VRFVRSLGLVVIATAVALAGCGEDRESGTGTSTTGTETEKRSTETETGAAAQPQPYVALKAITIEESEYKLSPNRVKLDKPGPYLFLAKNVGKTVHALELEGEGSEAQTDGAAPGKSDPLDATLKPGRYKLYCPVGTHEEAGMVGTVTVSG